MQPDSVCLFGKNYVKHDSGYDRVEYSHTDGIDSYSAILVWSRVSGVSFLSFFRKTIYGTVLYHNDNDNPSVISLIDITGERHIADFQNYAENTHYDCTWYTNGKPGDSLGKFNIVKRNGKIIRVGWVIDGHMKYVCDWLKDLDIDVENITEEEITMMRIRFMNGS